MLILVYVPHQKKNSHYRRARDFLIVKNELSPADSPQTKKY